MEKATSIRGSDELTSILEKTEICKILKKVNKNSTETRLALGSDMYIEHIVLLSLC